MSLATAKPEPVTSTAPSGPPEAIQYHTRSHCLELTWPGGQRVRLDTRQLRNHCLCSTCRAMKLQGWSGDSNNGVDLERAELFGVAGLQCFFSDGHDRGVFPWQYLIELDSVIGRRE